MLVTRSKSTLVITVTAILTCLGGLAARTATQAEAAKDGVFRVLVDDIVDEDGAIVKRLEIFSPVKTWAEVVPDNPGIAVVGASSPERAEADGSYRTSLIVFGDSIGGAPGILKFLMILNGGTGKASYSTTRAMPEGRSLGDVLTMMIKPGEYPYGEATRLAALKGLQYNLVVKRLR